MQEAVVMPRILEDRPRGPGSAEKFEVALSNGVLWSYLFGGFR